MHLHLPVSGTPVNWMVGHIHSKTSPAAEGECPVIQPVGDICNEFIAFLQVVGVHMGHLLFERSAEVFVSLPSHSLALMRAVMCSPLTTHQR